MTLRSMLIFACMFVLAGCATERELRNSSGSLALRIDETTEEARKFVAARTLVTKARTSTLHALEANALASEQSNQAEISYRTAAGDNAWVELLERLRKAPDLIAQQRKEQAAATAAARTAVQNARSAADFKVAKLAEASKALAALSEDRTNSEALGFYLGYVSDVKEAIAAKAKQAESSANAAADASAKKASDAATQAIAAQTQKNIQAATATKAAP